MPCVSPLGVTASKMSIKESLMRKGVKADTRLGFKELFFNGNFDSPLDEGKKPVFSLENPGIAVKAGMDYVATYSQKKYMMTSRLRWCYHILMSYS